LETENSEQEGEHCREKEGAWTKYKHKGKSSSSGVGRGIAPGMRKKKAFLNLPVQPKD
jgi:hypothetical protein